MAANEREGKEQAPIPGGTAAASSPGGGPAGDGLARGAPMGGGPASDDPAGDGPAGAGRARGRLAGSPPSRDPVESIEIEGVRVSAPASEFHAGARRLGRGLIVYGIVGCLLGAAGLIVAIVLLARLTLAGADILPRVDAISSTIDATARAMDDAAATSRSAASTIDTTMPSVAGLADTVDRTVPTLGRMGEALRSFSILGSQPLADAGTQFVALSADLKDLGPQLRGLSAGLTPDAVTLRESATSFTRLATELRSARDTLSGGVVQGSVVTVLAAALLLIVALIAWVLVPAVGGLVLGVWLLRRVAPEDLPARLRGATPR